MNLANTVKQKRAIAVAERYVHRQLHEHFLDPRYFPGHEGSRLNVDRIEWYEGIDLEVITKLMKHAERGFGGVLCRGNENYATKWRAYQKNQQKKRTDWDYGEVVDFWPKIKNVRR